MRCLMLERIPERCFLIILATFDLAKPIESGRLIRDTLAWTIVCYLQALLQTYPNGGATEFVELD